MAYIGNPVTKDFTSTTSVQTLTGDGSTSYSLSTSVSNPEHIAVLRNGVRAKPTTDYTVSGSTITFTTALDSADTCFVIFLGQVEGSIVPSADSITPAMLTTFNGVYNNLATVTSTVDVDAADNAFLAGPVTFTGTVTVAGTLTVV